MANQTTNVDPQFIAEQRKAQKAFNLLPETLEKRTHNLGIPDDQKAAWIVSETESLNDYYEALDAGMSDADARLLAWPAITPNQKAALGGAGDGAAAPQVEAAPEPAAHEEPVDGKIGLIVSYQGSVAYTGKKDNEPYSVTLHGHVNGRENRVTPEQLAWLEGEETFKTQRDKGFITRVK